MNHSLQPRGQEWSVLFQLTSEAQSMQKTAANGESSIWAPELRVLLAQLTPQSPWLTRNRAHLHYISPLSASDEREKCRRLSISYRHWVMMPLSGNLVSLVWRGWKDGLWDIANHSLFLTIITKSSKLDSQNNNREGKRQEKRLEIDV